MKKILLIIHGDHFPDSALEFVSTINQAGPVLLTGFFIPSIVPIENWAAYSDMSVGVIEDVTTSANMDRFKTLCKKYHIEYRSHAGATENVLEQIIKETRFSDLLIVNARAFYREEGEKDPYPYLKKVIHSAECPVLLVPQVVYLPEKILLCYDGGRQSVFAIKQFAYLFPEFGKLPAEVCYFSETGKDIPNRESLEEWCKIYFNDLTFQGNGQPATASSGILEVAGSYDRSSLSQWLNKSFAENAVKAGQVILFIAHP